MPKSGCVRHALTLVLTAILTSNGALAVAKQRPHEIPRIRPLGDGAADLLAEGIRRSPAEEPGARHRGRGCHRICSALASIRRPRPRTYRYTRRRRLERLPVSLCLAPERRPIRDERSRGQRECADQPVGSRAVTRAGNRRRSRRAEPAVSADALRANRVRCQCGWRHLPEIRVVERPRSRAPRVGGTAVGVHSTRPIRRRDWPTQCHNHRAIIGDQLGAA